MRKIIASLIVSFVLLVILPSILLAHDEYPTPNGFVNDFAQILTSEQKNALEQKLSQFEKDSSHEISIVTIKSLEGDTIEEYATAIFKQWGIGKTDKDNGVLLLVAIDDHKMRIEVGYGLEGSLTDLLSSRIIRETLTPAFKNNDFYEGIDKALNQIEKITYGEVPKELHQTESPINNFKPEYLFFGFIILSWISSILARSRSWWAGGVVGFVAGIILSIFFGFMLVGLIAILILTPLGLLFDFLVSRAYTDSKSSGTKTPWWAGGGGFGGGSSGGGSSFGGFSGGSSGGGGSSGSW